MKTDDNGVEIVDVISETEFRAKVVLLLEEILIILQEDSP